VRVSGPATRAIAKTLLRPARVPRPRVATRARIVGRDGATIDDGLALFFGAPASYTGEDVLELHLHGSPALVRDVLIAVLEAGARLAGPGEFTRRAYLAGKLDLSAAEAIAALIDADRRSAARAAAANLSGGLAGAVDALRARLLALASELAGAIDFPDEVPSPLPARLRAEIGEVRAALEALAVDWERGRLVREGIAIAIVGPPNAGKSSLLNALLGVERAIVSEVPGTTRDTVEEYLALGDATARIVDTAGIRAHASRVEAEGIARSEAALAQAAVALLIVDGSRALDAAAEALLARTRGRPRVVFFNKADLGRAGFDARDDAEAAALLGSAFAAADVERVRAALAAAAGAGDEVDAARAHLGTARQAAAVVEAMRALDFALRTLDDEAPVDLLAGELATAAGALGEIGGRDLDERILDEVFARFCVGK